MKYIPLSGRNPTFQETLDVKPHMLILNKMDLADMSNKQVRRFGAFSAVLHLTFKNNWQSDNFTYTLQRTLKMLKKDGVNNVVFTDCLKQRDDNVKQVNIISLRCKH